MDVFVSLCGKQQVDCKLVFGTISQWHAELCYQFSDSTHALLARLVSFTGLEFGKSQRAVENKEKWRKLVAKSSVVPQRPSLIRD